MLMRFPPFGWFWVKLTLWAVRRLARQGHPAGLLREETVGVKGGPTVRLIVGDDWDERIVVCRNRGPMREVFMVPSHEEPPGDGTEWAKWHVWWYGTFGGQEYGSYVAACQGQCVDLPEVTRMAYEQACVTFDKLADDAVGFSGSVPALLCELMGRRGIVGDEQFGFCVWLDRVGEPNDRMRDDSYWLGRAEARLGLQEGANRSWGDGEGSLREHLGAEAGELIGLFAPTDPRPDPLAEWWDSYWRGVGVGLDREIRGEVDDGEAGGKEGKEEVDPGH